MNNVIINPPKDWVELLAPNHKVWLVKEEREAIVSIYYRHPGYFEAFKILGRLSLIIDDEEVRWDVSVNGKGFDDSQLILPIEGNISSREFYEHYGAKLI